MQQAVLHHYPNLQAVYRFTHRSKDVYFSRTCIERFRQCLPRAFPYSSCSNKHAHCSVDFASLALTSEERDQLEKHCPYFKPAYLDYLAAYRFKPDQVHLKFVPKEDDQEWGQIELEAHGLWAETIMWEVPLMACLSETYFSTDDTDWNYDGQAGEYFLLLSLPKTIFTNNR
jgi:nicotinate phosphoribosyltransferase